MSDEIIAAAERLRGIEGPTFRGVDGRRHISVQEYCDAVTLAQAYLAEHPASSAELVTEDRLPAFGFRTSYRSPSPGHKFDKWVTLPAATEGECLPLPLPPWAEVTVTASGLRLETYGSDRGFVRLDNPTAGELLWVLAALKVRVREGGGA